MESYVAGMQKFLKPFLCMYAPTVNSYTRLVKGAWAPTTATWGVENRTTALRVIPGERKSQRVEFRLGAADGNPYLVAAACIGSGFVEHFAASREWEAREHEKAITDWQLRRYFEII